MLKFLGRGSAFYTKEGNTSAYIKENRTLFLIDCRSNIFERIIFKDLLYDVDEVHVAITHMHPDHVGSLGDLIFYCYYSKKIKISVYSVDKNIVRFLNLNGITDGTYTLYREYVAYIPALYLFMHFDPIKHTDMLLCYSITLIRDHKTVFYSGDTSGFNWFGIEHDQYYIDTCFANYMGNIHYNVDQLYKDCTKFNKDIVPRIWCMHFDCAEAILRAKELGFNIVSNGSLWLYNT